MKKFVHKSHTAIQLIKNRAVIIKNHDKIQMFHRYSRFANWRFLIYPNRKWSYFHWLIRLPFLYFERDGGGLYIGTPNSFLWLIRRARRQQE
nr:MAG TPA: hypothetical protein [Caudoviricetes sp.]